MKSIKMYTILFIAFFISASFVPVAVWAGDFPDPDTYLPTWSEVRKHKKLYDDPSPWLKT